MTLYRRAIVFFSDLIFSSLPTDWSKSFQVWDGSGMADSWMGADTVTAAT